MNRATDEFRFACPHCEQHLQCGSELAGREISCPGCGQLLAIPDPPQGEPVRGGEGNADTGDSAERIHGLCRRGEGPLACGLGLLVVTAYLAPQVMLSLVAFLLLPLVLALFLIGLRRARNRLAPAGWQVVGLLLLVPAFSGLLLATFLAVGTSAREARLAQIWENKVEARTATGPGGSRATIPPEVRAQVESEMQALAQHPAYAPPRRHWTGAAARWLAPVSLALGLLCWAGWSPLRCLIWGGVVVVLPHTVAWMIHVLGPVMALSA